MSKNSKVSPDVTEQWPGVLDEVDINVVPIQYIKSIEVRFIDGKVWVMDIDHRKLSDDNAADEVEESIEELLEEYQDSIEGINFVVDIPKVKRDITKRTNLFLKKRR